MAAAVASSRVGLAGTVGDGGGPGELAHAANKAAAIAMHRRRRRIMAGFRENDTARGRRPAGKKPRTRRGSILVARRRLAAERTTTTLARARRTFLSFIHSKRTAVHLVTVETLDRRLCFGRTHLDETKSTG